MKQFNSFLSTIKIYNAHTSILSIKEKMINNLIPYQNSTYEKILNEINNIDFFKSTHLYIVLTFLAIFILTDLKKPC